jgi:hypothetical protein
LQSLPPHIGSAPLFLSHQGPPHSRTATCYNTTHGTRHPHTTAQPLTTVSGVERSLYRAMS